MVEFGCNWVIVDHCPLLVIWINLGLWEDVGTPMTKDDPRRERRELGQCPQRERQWRVTHFGGPSDWNPCLCGGRKSSYMGLSDQRG